MKTIVLLFGLLCFVGSGYAGWQPISSSSNFLPFSMSFANDQLGYAAGLQDDIFSGVAVKTTDGGKTWTPFGFLDPNDISTYLSISVTPKGKAVACFTGFNIDTFDFYEGVNSSDGNTWTPTRGLPSDAAWLSVQAIDPSSAFLFGEWGFDNGFIGGAAVSVDSGKTFALRPWEEATDTDVGFVQDGFFVDANNGYLIVENVNNSFAKRVNGQSLSFSAHSRAHFDLQIKGGKRSLDISREPKRAPDAIDIVKTTDGGKTWKVVLNDPLDQIITAIHFVDVNTGWALVDDVSDGSSSAGSVFRTKNGGQTWEQQLVNNKAVLYLVSFVDAQRGWVVGDVLEADGQTVSTAFWKTVNGGASWTLEDSLPSFIITDIHFLSATVGFASGIDGNGNGFLLKYIP